MLLFGAWAGSSPIAWTSGACSRSPRRRWPSRPLVLWILDGHRGGSTLDGASRWLFARGGGEREWTTPRGRASWWSWWGARPDGERDRAEQRRSCSRPASSGPALAGVVIATLRRLNGLPDQRDLLRRDARGATRHGHRRAPTARLTPRASAASCVPRCATCAPRRTLLIPLAPDGRGGHAVVQLPDAAAAASALLLSRPRRHVRRADQRDGRGRAGRRAVRQRARRRWARACSPERR